jgi:hypothetical protein
MLEAPLPKSEALDSHLRWLRAALMPAYEFLRAWMHKGEVSIYCGISIDGDSRRFVLSSEALKLFVELDLTLDLSLVFTGYSDFDLEHRESGVAGGQTPEAAQTSDRAYSEASLRFDLDAELGPAGAATRLEAAAVQVGSGGWEPAGEKRGAKSLVINAPVDSTQGLDAHFRWIDSFISQHSDTIRELKATATCRPIVSCSFTTQRDQDTSTITSRALRLLTEMDIPVEFTVKLMGEKGTDAILGSAGVVRK